MEEPLAFVSLSCGLVPGPYEAGISRCYKAAELESAVGFETDAFQVEDLLEFSNDDIAGSIAGFQMCDRSYIESPVTRMEPGGLTKTTSSFKTSCQSSNQSCLEEQLGMDFEFAELDWLSKFVEESYSSGEYLKLHTVTSSVMSEHKRSEANTNTDLSNAAPSVTYLESSSTSTDSLLSETYVPGRVRSKRCRSGVRIWSSEILASPLSLVSSICDPTEICFSSLDCSELYSDIYSTDSEGVRSRQEQVQGLEAEKIAAKLSKGKKWRVKGSSMQYRRCTHCLAQRTPQWRAGPLGPKTLCNACGVRYKSGRLYPEYRPAASPTFLSDVHSNSHRKVMQMRRQKETKLYQTSTDFTTDP